MPPANIDSKKVSNDGIHVLPDVLEECLSQFAFFNKFMSKHSPDLSDELTRLGNVPAIQSRIDEFQKSANVIVSCLQNGSAGNLIIQRAMVQHFLHDISQLISLLKRLTLSELEVQMRENQHDTELKELIEDAQSNEASHSGDPQSSEETVTTEISVDGDEPNIQNEEIDSEPVEGLTSQFSFVQEYISKLSELESVVLGIISPPLSNEEMSERLKKGKKGLEEIDFRQFDSYEQGFTAAMRKGHRRDSGFREITLTSKNRTFDVSIDLIILVSFLRGHRAVDANRIITSYWEKLKRGLERGNANHLISVLYNLGEFATAIPKLDALFRELKNLKQFLKPVEQ